MDEKVVSDLNPHHWAKESYAISTAFVYDDITENEPVDGDYTTKGRKLAEKQIVIAGTRLANLLKTFKFPLEEVKLKDELIDSLYSNFLEEKE